MAQVASLIDFRGEGAPHDVGSFLVPAHIVVYQASFSGTTYVCAARQAERGWVLISYLPLTGANATTVINAALAGLTAGRTWKETVVVVGNYVDLEQISISSYTVLELHGKLKAKAGLNTDFIVNSDPIGGNTHIEIYGGEIDPNGPNQTADMNGIHLQKVTYPFIHDLKIYAAHRAATYMGEGIRLYFCSFGIVKGIYGISVTGGYDLIKIWAGSYHTVVGNVIDGSGGGVSRTIQVAMDAPEDASYVSIIGNVVYQGEGGVKVHSGHQVTILGNVLIQPTRGIWMPGATGANNLIVVGNVIWNAVSYGINFLGGAINCIFSNNIIKVGDTGSPIGLRMNGTGANYNLFKGNFFLGGASASDTAISIAANNNYNIFEGNYFDTAWATLVSDAGTGNKFKRNEGYVTENTVLSPTFTIDSVGIKTVTIPHGLNITPAKKDCTLTVVEETDVDDWRFDLLKVDSVDATNVVAKINVSTASGTAGATARLALRVGAT